MHKSGLMIWSAALTTATHLGACAQAHEGGVESTAPALSAAEPYDTEARAELRDASGKCIGHATFSSDGETTLVFVSARLPPEGAGIHGMHIHANDVADNGVGCIADPAAPASTHFVSVDGHFNPGGASHGHHHGDLPPLFFDQTGEAWLKFKTDQFHPDELRGRALILHAASDNYGNIPLGDGPDQYTANSAEATAATAKTGNAGARIGCGVIE
jgi:Cu-Zn family superoxide dismutase